MKWLMVGKCYVLLGKLANCFFSGNQVGSGMKKSPGLSPCFGKFPGFSAVSLQGKSSHGTWGFLGFSLSNLNDTGCSPRIRRDAFFVGPEIPFCCK